MAILIGIDEAGYGPLLGPLVVSGTGFELPDELLAQPLWDVLRQSVTKNRSGSSGRIVINDSKKIHHKQGDYKLLQRGVLACLNAGPSEKLPNNAGELLQLLSVRDIDQLNDYPWYNSTAKDWPLKYDKDDINTTAAALKTNLSQNNIKIVGLWTHPLPAGHFNQLVNVMNNKATVLFHLAGQIIYRAWQKFSNDNLNIVIDKQGGRTRYRMKLQRMFPELDMKIIKENEAISSYQLSDANSCMKIHFVAKGDQRQLPVALASMTSKYVRELFMEMLNAYFNKNCPGITPTAGYYKDGKRFIADLETYDQAETLRSKQILVRQR